MQYTFSFTSSSGDETTYLCDAKILNDALSQFAIFVYSNSLDVSAFSYYYYVDGKNGKSQRIFNSSLIHRFWNFYHIASTMDKCYGIDKQEIL